MATKSTQQQQSPSTTGDQCDDVQSIRTPCDENAWIRLMTRVGWYPKDMPSDEKLLILKLDLAILVYGCISQFTKCLDQQSLTNAYVSGMKEDLDLKGNDLNYLVATYWAAYCIFMVPAIYTLTHYPANKVLPTLEVGWGLSTFGLAWAQNISTVYAMRFFTGLFECCNFAGTIYIIGSWYKPGELGRRLALLAISNPLGTMISGYLQAAAHVHLNHVHDLAGWRWLFIIDAAITVGVGMLGFLVFPDMPSRKKPRTLTSQEHRLAQKRLEGVTAPPRLTLSLSAFKRVFARWHWYLLVLQYSCGIQIGTVGLQPFSLYLKAKSDIYSVVQINTIPTIVSAMNIVSDLLGGLVADRIRLFWPPLVASALPVLAGLVLLVAWEVGEGGRLLGFILTGFGAAYSPLIMGWASVLMVGDAEERAIVVASMNAISQGIMAGTQTVQFPASAAPNFHGGFISVLCITVLQVGSCFLILYLERRDLRRHQNGHDADSEAGSVTLGESKSLKQ
ncbi:MFS general substrate transporter [Xylariomycetidae sp. FL2044]|nr:MFS general substrate transporter [Xylariomycetidae sp. FL2044]